jgi:hypothetical protein
MQLWFQTRIEARQKTGGRMSEILEAFAFAAAITTILMLGSDNNKNDIKELQIQVKELKAQHLPENKDLKKSIQEAE